LRAYIAEGCKLAATARAVILAEQAPHGGEFRPDLLTRGRTLMIRSWWHVRCSDGTAGGRAEIGGTGSGDSYCYVDGGEPPDLLAVLSTGRRDGRGDSGLVRGTLSPRHRKGTGQLAHPVSA
jgi:hypothetical protein